MIRGRRFAQESFSQEASPKKRRREETSPGNRIIASHAPMSGRSIAIRGRRRARWVAMFPRPAFEAAWPHRGMGNSAFGLPQV
jgi:hypothetical protein